MPWKILSKRGRHHLTGNRRWLCTWQSDLSKPLTIPILFYSSSGDPTVLRIQARLPGVVPLLWPPSQAPPFPSTNQPPGSLTPTLLLLSLNLYPLNVQTLPGVPVSPPELDTLTLTSTLACHLPQEISPGCHVPEQVRALHLALRARADGCFSQRSSLPALS